MESPDLGEVVEEELVGVEDSIRATVEAANAVSVPLLGASTSPPRTPNEGVDLRHASSFIEETVWRNGRAPTGVGVANAVSMPLELRSTCMDEHWRCTGGRKGTTGHDVVNSQPRALEKRLTLPFFLSQAKNLLSDLLKPG